MFKHLFIRSRMRTPRPGAEVRRSPDPMPRMRWYP